MGLLHVLGTDLADGAELTAEATAIIDDLGAVTMRQRLDLALGTTPLAARTATA